MGGGKSRIYRLDNCNQLVQTNIPDLTPIDLWLEEPARSWREWFLDNSASMKSKIGELDDYMVRNLSMGDEYSSVNPWWVNSPTCRGLQVINPVNCLATPSKPLRRCPPTSVHVPWEYVRSGRDRCPDTKSKLDWFLWRRSSVFCMACTFNILELGCNCPHKFTIQYLNGLLLDLQTFISLSFSIKHSLS